MENENRSYFLRGSIDTFTLQNPPFFIYTILPSSKLPANYFLTYDQENVRFVLRQVINPNEIIQVFLETVDRVCFNLYIRDPSTTSNVTILDGINVTQRIYLALNEDNTIIPSDTPYDFRSSTTDVNPWGIFLTGVNYSLLNTCGVTANFLIEGSTDSFLFGILPQVYYVPSVDGTCEPKTDSIEAHLSWVMGELDNFRGWTTQLECENGRWYTYCPPTVRCGNEDQPTDCKGPCSSGNVCIATSEESLFSCVPIRSLTGEEPRSNEITGVWLFVIAIILAIIAVTWVLILNRNRSI